MPERLVDFNQEFRPFDPEYPFNGKLRKDTAAKSAPFHLIGIGEGSMILRAVVHDTDNPMMIDFSSGIAKVVPFETGLGVAEIEVGLGDLDVKSNPNIGCRLFIDALAFNSSNAHLESRIPEGQCVFYNFEYQGKEPRDLIIPINILERIRLVFEDLR